MAENEILYIVNAARWRGTRRALKAGESPAAVAGQLLEEMNRGVRNTLVGTFKKGATLLTLLHAAGESRDALRAVVDSFTDRQLARLVSAAIKACGSASPTEIARFAGDRILDQVHERALCYAGQCGTYQSERARAELSQALSARFDQYRPELLAILEESMRGQRVQRPPRRSTTRASLRVRVKDVVETSLLPPGSGHAAHATRRH
jgi:hypothetical protein